MATYNKFDVFTQNLVNGVHNFTSDAFKVMLTNSAPSAANAILSDITEISAGNGYSAGGSSTTMSLGNASGVEKVTATDVVFTASGGTIGPFRYVVVYDTTPSSPLKPLISWFDYGSNVTLNSGDSFTVDFDGSNGLFTVT